MMTVLLLVVWAAGVNSTPITRAPALMSALAMVMVYSANVVLVMAALAVVLYLLGREGRGPSRLGRRTGQALVATYLLHQLAVLITAGPG